MSYESVSSDNMDILEVGLQNRLNQYSDTNLTNSRDIAPETIAMLYALFE